MLNILIADDEHLARETVKLLLKSTADVVNVYEAEDGNQALILANQYQPDIVILDIEMPGISGIELAKHLPKRCIIIFVTAYTEHAIDAFEINAIDYILKPFDDQRFFVALDRAKQKLKDDEKQDYTKIGEMIQQMALDKQAQYRLRLVIRDPGRIRLIDVDQIDYITGAGNYAEIHLSDASHLLHRETLSALETQLDPSIFVRIHRSSIVRRSCIAELRPNDKGDYSVILQNGDVLTLSRRNRTKLDELTN